MTPLNTIIEEEKEAFDEKFQDPMEKKHGKGFALYCSYCDGTWRDEIKDLLTTAMQRAYEAGRISWLRSEIEKLEPLEEPLPATSMTAREALAHNKLLSSIITRYKEELKELESR